MLASETGFVLPALIALSAAGFAGAWLASRQARRLRIELAAQRSGLETQAQALRDQIKLTRDLIDGNPNPVYLKDEQCRFVEINQAYGQLTGFSHDQVAGRTVLELYPGDRGKLYDQQDRDLLARGAGSSEIEVDLQRRSGQHQYFLMSKSLLKRADGSVRGLVGTLTDVSKLKRAEQVVRESEERMRFWMENIPIPIAIYDPEGSVEYLNPAFVATFGWPLEEMRGRRMPFVPPERQQELAGVLHNLRTLGKDAFETQRLTRSGQLLDVYISTGMARDRDGAPRATMVSLMDVSGRKRMERELAASREAALQAAHAKAAFLAAMSHEIRTPLNGVLGMAGLLTDTALSAEQREYVETIRISGDALLSVINDILDYSKIESGRMDMELEPYEPVRAIEESLEILGEGARAKGLELIAEVDDGVPEWVRGDFSRLRQVLVNLVGNAVKFTERGEVLVRVRAATAAGDAASLEIAVSDTGIGIAPDRLQTLFEAFTQADASTTRKYGGTGLGLTISRRLVELMGGMLQASSAPGAGSTFTFTIVVHRCEPPAGLIAPAEPVDLTGRRILIVDDNATNLRILRRQLERWGAVPVSASSPEAALALLASDDRLDAALLDYHMPGMDGVMLARRIKALARTSRAGALPLVLLSSSMYRRAEEAEPGLFVAQLLKPVRLQNLRQAIALALAGTTDRRPGRQSPPAEQPAPAPRALAVLVVDDVEVNRRVAQLMLRKLGHGPDEVSSGLEAVERTASQHYDLVLMDLQMPDIDGFEATRRIRSRLGAATPRIVAMTANAMPGDRERCIAAGMDGYLSKPIVLRALAEELLGATLPSLAPPQPIVDLQRLQTLAQYDDADRPMLRGMIDAFLREAPRDIAALRAALAKRDHAALARSAHALKGAAANAGAQALAEVAARIESAGPGGATVQSIEALETLFASTAAALAAIDIRAIR